MQARQADSIVGVSSGRIACNATAALLADEDAGVALT
jgi:hypothetical protein